LLAEYFGFTVEWDGINQSINLFQTKTVLLRLKVGGSGQTRPLLQSCSPSLLINLEDI
jgi:hypothetical protein